MRYQPLTALVLASQGVQAGNDGTWMSSLEARTLIGGILIACLFGGIAYFVRRRPRSGAAKTEPGRAESERESWGWPG